MCEINAIYGSADLRIDWSMNFIAGFYFCSVGLRIVLPDGLSE